MRFNFLYITLVLGLLLGLVSCQDDRLYDDSVIPEGETLVSATLNFESFTSALESRAAGDAIKAIKTLNILIYDTEGNLLETHTKDELTDYKEETNTNYPEDWPDKNGVDNPGYPEQGVEGSTPRATFKFKLPMGRYYIYAVANYDLTGKDVSTVEKLKNIKLTWDKTAIANNSEMFGYFTLTNTIGADKFQPDAPITLNKSVSTIHSWIKRAASKITIAYDAKNMKNGVFVYLKKATIKDIPASCFLGADNTPSSADDLIAEGESFKYYKGDTPPAYDEKYPARLTRGGNTSTFGSDHAEKSDALFFYENMQGKGKDKRQDANGDNILDAPGLPGDEKYVLKDDKPYGTYIEVEAYYVQINAGHVSSGDIKYRFMLGKDVTTDYNAERNHHYKLTLKFNGNANDVDWHIEYKEEKPGVETPEIVYISYLYNRTMNLPVKINTGNDNVKVKSVKATIRKNCWAPYEADKTGLDYSSFDREGNNVWNGFLSLHKTVATVLTSNPADNNPPSVVYIEGTTDKGWTSANQVYFEKAPSRGVRSYTDMTDGSHTTTGSESDDMYSVKKDTKLGGVYHMEIPLYTRAKQLIPRSAYTGNNPYVAYQRRAVVDIDVVLDNGVVIPTKSVEVRQVRRIVNPKGVYREWNNNTSFSVSLKRLPMERSLEFEDFPSEGIWKAYVAAGDANFVKLDGKDEVSGDTGSKIQFDIDFVGECDENSSRHAIIRVEYHNLTCYHLIFVRQGSAPVQMVENGCLWHTFNLKSSTEEATSPCDEGSLFRFGNLDDPIAASNLVNPKTPWINVTPDDFESWVDKDFTIEGQKETKKWDEITFQPAATGSFGEITLSNGKKVSVASYNDFESLYADGDIEQGYGVLYGDKAKTTASDLDDVYGGSGMRGCFVYSKSSGKNLFFPIGASGYGRIKDGRNEGGKRVVLRYSSGQWTKFPSSISSIYPNSDVAPLFYDLYMRPGAAYWLNRMYNSPRSKNIIAWDFNYFTFDFNLLPMVNVYNGTQSDATHIRCVENSK